MTGKVQTRQVDAMGRVVIPKDVRDRLELQDEPLVLQHEMNRQAVLVTKEHAGKNPEELKVLDEQGRLLIPAEVRHEYEWDQGEKIEVYVENDTIRLQGLHAKCSICESRDSLLKIKGGFLCRDCHSHGSEAVVNRWQLVLQELLQEYMENCERALSFSDMEELHQARVKGRRLQELLQFLGVKKDHKIVERLQEAHKRLGNVRERDVLIQEFEKRAEEEKQEHARVFHEVAELVKGKRQKEQEKLAKNLPKTINHKFQEHWDTFFANELRALVLPLEINERLQTLEDTFAQKRDDYMEIAEKEGPASKQALKSLHNVRIQAKKLRYVYTYLETILGGNYKEQAKRYKNYQRRFGEINDKRDWLRKTKDCRKELDVSEEQWKEVKEKLEQELQDQAAGVVI